MQLSKDDRGHGQNKRMEQMHRVGRVTQFSQEAGRGTVDQAFLGYHAKYDQRGRQAYRQEAAIGQDRRGDLDRR